MLSLVQERERNTLATGIKQTHQNLIKIVLIISGTYFVMTIVVKHRKNPILTLI